MDSGLESLLADLKACGRETTAALEKLPVDHPVPVSDEPWIPKDLDSWPLRWVIGHLIQELARHAGHGETMYEPQAMAGWHAGFLKIQQQYAQ